MAPQKGKVATKGKKQILEENRQTLSFYRNMVLSSNVAHILVLLFVFSSFDTFEKICTVLSALVHVSTYQFLVYMARTKYSSDGQLLDGGLDLNMESGIAEHIKDIIIVTSLCQLASLVSAYFWLIWLFVPLRGCQLLWKHLLGPYFLSADTDPSQGDTDQLDDKKQRKMARKMRYSTINASR